jgi:hypothetical protein
VGYSLPPLPALARAKHDALVGLVGRILAAQRLPVPARQTGAAPAAPPGPGLKVAAFVDLMRKMERMRADLSGDQVRFVQLCVQRFEPDQQGVVKTKRTLRQMSRIQNAGKKPSPKSP